MLKDRRLRFAAVAALALHALALAWLRPPAYVPLRGASAAPALQVVLSSTAIDRDLAGAQATPAAPVTSAQAAPEAAAAAPAPDTPAATPPEAPRPLAAQDEPGTGAGGPVEYLARERLTVPARPLSAVPIPFPEVDGLVDLKVRVALLIDDDGAVRQVRLETPEVPSRFAEAIQQAFAQARFQPGELDSVPVPSQLRIEVEFSSAQR